MVKAWDSTLHRYMINFNRNQALRGQTDIYRLHQPLIKLDGDAFQVKKLLYWALKIVVYELEA